MTEFAKIIRSSRKKEDYTLEELSQKLNVDRSYLSKLENNRVPAPSKRLLKKMSEVLNLDFETLSLLAGRMTENIVKDLDLKKVELFRAIKNKNFSEKNYQELLNQINRK